MRFFSLSHVMAQRLSGYHHWKCPVCGTCVSAPGQLALRQHLTREHQIKKDLHKWVNYARPVQKYSEMQVLVPGLALTELLLRAVPPLLEEIVEAEVVEDEY